MNTYIVIAVCQLASYCSRDTLGSNVGDGGGVGLNTAVEPNCAVLGVGIRIVCHELTEEFDACCTGNPAAPGSSWITRNDRTGASVPVSGVGVWSDKEVGLVTSCAVVEDLMEGFILGVVDFSNVTACSMAISSLSESISMVSWSESV